MSLPYPRKIPVLLFVLATLTAALFFAGCTRPSRHPGVMVSDEEIYLKCCGNCHDPYPDDFFPIERWQRFLKTHPELKKDRPSRKEAAIVAQYLGLQ